MQSGWVSQGRVTEEFETLLAGYCGSNHAIVVNNGSSALLCALMAHDAKPGDHVLVPDYTHVATANVPRLLGCRISSIDIDPSTFNIDCQALERAIKQRRPKFVVVVDVAGLPNNVECLWALARRYRFTLIEDAAESMGAEYKHQRVGSHGHATILSFHAAKQLTTVEGGAVLTDDSSVAKRCRLVRNHGELLHRKYHSKSVGMNLRITDIQSAIGIAQLKKIDEYLSRRNQVARVYREELKESCSFQLVPSYVSKHAYMMFIAITRSRKTRDALKRHLDKNGIETRIPWPPIHQQPQFRTSGAAFHHSSDLYNRAISLPMYNTITDSDVERVASEVQAFELR
jgi:perosamine synthetase